MTISDPRNDGSYISMSLDALSWAETSAEAASLFTGQIQFSVDAWIRFNGLPANTAVIGKNGVFAFGSQGPSIYFQFADLPIILSDLTVSKLQDDHWHYICATFDGSAIRLYIDGQFNAGQNCMGQVTSNKNPVFIGQGVQGLIKRVRIYNIVLDSETVLTNMYGTPASSTLVADFDFSINAPIDRGPSSYPINLQNNAFMVKISPAVSLGNTGFIRPLNDSNINPGGGQNDPYSLQAWIFVSKQINPNLIQTIFANSDLMLDTGMALYLQYDSSVLAYRLVSQRGSGRTGGQTLASAKIVPVGIWTNVATTFDGINLSLYINGKLDSSIACTPIPLYRQFSDLLIGATIEEGNPSGVTTLQGFIREVDVWSRALSNAEIANFMDAPPDVESDGLQGAYVFTNSPARNQVNGHPIALAEGAVLSGQLEPAPVTAYSCKSDSVEIPEMGINPEIMEKIRAELNIRQIYESNRKAFDVAQDADIAAFDDPADKELIRKAWAEFRDKMVNDPTSLPFLMTHHKIDGEHLLIIHRPSGSYVAYRTAEENIDSCTLWKINLVFIVIAGALSAFTGIGAKLTDKAIAYILRILTTPKISSIMALGTSMTASNIFSMLGTFCELGMLRQLILLVIDVGFWTLIRVIAKILLIAAGIGSAYVIASLVATAGIFIITYANRPASCDPLPTVNLASISFDHDPTGASVEALTIRHNFGSNISVPEWIPSKTLPEEAPCAYVINAVSGKIPTIKVVLNISTATPRSISIRATGGGILGAINPVTVNFGSSTTVEKELPLSNHTLAVGGIQSADVIWNWQYQVDDSAWINMASTSHRVYVTLSAPTAPWQQTPDRTNLNLPWTDVLDYACDWAKGAKSIDEILSLITIKVNSGINLEYDDFMGKSYYTIIFMGMNLFQCTQFIDFLKTNVGNGKNVNCTDCATIVTTFGNILGADACEAVISDSKPPVDGFLCNQILAIGKTTWKVPFGIGFSYHEVVWTGAGSSLIDNLYDACLRYPIDDDPWKIDPNHKAGLPVKVPFTTLESTPQIPISAPFLDSSYRERLAANKDGGIPKCKPQGSWDGTNSGHRQVI
ncbi:LamG domain-containing protein [Methanosarcina sp. T3]|uniref:LamG domain-containing protein n=1 Tax=Methanosarcina sp. T3 TaxID=3439062 RepID=UPI003F87BC7B